MDSRGLRVEEDESAAEETGRKRILFVGDSVTMGYYLPARQAFPALTAELLNARLGAGTAVALNGGVCGYDTRQECHWLTHEGLALRPDVVVLQFCLNDLAKQYDPEQGADQSRHPEFAWARPQTSWSGIHRAILAMKTRWKYGNDLQDAAARIEQFDVLDCLTAPGSERVRGAWRVVEQQLGLFVRACRHAGVPMVLVCFPVAEQIREPELGAAPQAVLARFAKDQSIPYLDLLPVFCDRFGACTDAAARAYRDLTHPTLAGHRAAAESLADLLQRSGLVTGEVKGATSVRIGH
jgi:lysophospholipase L1-like esterase